MAPTSVRFQPAMSFVASLRLVLPLLFAFTLAAPSVEDSNSPVCTQIGTSISSSSDVYYLGTIPKFYFALYNNIHHCLGDPLYSKGVYHWANYTSRAAKCVVEPGTPADVGIIVIYSFFSAHPNS